ncbi:MAG TPA: Crp/Fnr family transcriptional regulator [Chitinophagaceae bacterium]|jgi:CRP-like cAMP-binding protein|nr:Crp/Fnr family transcriptional regulator [Chitinophagaceae bacterium]
MNRPVANPVLQPSFNNQKDISALIATLNYFHPLSNAAAEYLTKIIQPVSYKKGKLLLKAGELCDHVFFIKKGVVRGFIKEGHKDITTWITAENEMVTSISSLDNREPNEENMQAIENCEMLAITFDDLENLYIKFPEFNFVVRKLLQKYYRDAEGRAYIARLTNAETKYRHFIRNHSHLANRIPLKYIASFLGITLETLSRVRKKISSRSN